MQPKFGWRGELAAWKFGGLVGKYIYAYVMRISRCLFTALFLQRIWRARRYALCKVPTLLWGTLGESLDFLARGKPTTSERERTLALHIPITLGSRKLAQVSSHNYHYLAHRRNFQASLTLLRSEDHNGRRIPLNYNTGTEAASTIKS
ncbi:hypothetical protein ALC60_02108 [Trachymyrmex zeteki]|uniref:Uncharacterized protein n=1 Tax=Mycetomoellerius zeteki TaxID=64791 RepID=A0A151XEY4_9HYME|nr:hypothetical protein ALC60_02108 [Trachymyrmex zeteki]